MIEEVGVDGTALRVAIIDDDPQQLKAYSGLLRRNDIEVFTVLGEDEGEDMVDAIAAFRPHVVLVDLLMPHVSGHDLIQLLRERLPNSYYVVFSALCAERVRRTEESSGADGALSKTLPPRMFVAAVKSYEDAQAKGNG